MADAQEKKLPPTQKRLRDARERGQVATSRDLSMAAGLLGATSALAMAGSLLLDGLLRFVLHSLAAIGRAPLHDVQGARARARASFEVRDCRSSRRILRAPTPGATAVSRPAPDPATCESAAAGRAWRRS